MSGKKVDASWVLVGAMLGAILMAVGLVLAKQERPAPIIIEPAPPTATPVATATPGPINVYVSGAVRQVGVYQLPPESLVADAIRLAGDFTAEAASERVNLAQRLVDGMQIHVPRLQEVGVGGEAEQPVIQVPAQALSGEMGDSLVNINTAGPAELDALPGIGPATAANIIAHREANGPFARIEDIMDVSGIGPAKFEQMKELITVDSR
jgi:competence protein ComEA